MSRAGAFERPLETHVLSHPDSPTPTTQHTHDFPYHILRTNTPTQTMFLSAGAVLSPSCTNPAFPWLCEGNWNNGICFDDASYCPGGADPSHWQVLVAVLGCGCRGVRVREYACLERSLKRPCSTPMLNDAPVGGGAGACLQLPLGSHPLLAHPNLTMPPSLPQVHYSGHRYRRRFNLNHRRWGTLHPRY